MKYNAHLAKGKLWKAAKKEKMKAGASAALSLQEKLSAEEARADKWELRYHCLNNAVKYAGGNRKLAILQRERIEEKKAEEEADV